MTARQALFRELVVGERFRFVGRSVEPDVDHFIKTGERTYDVVDARGEPWAEGRVGVGDNPVERWTR